METTTKKPGRPGKNPYKDIETITGDINSIFLQNDVIHSGMKIYHAQIERLSKSIEDLSSNQKLDHKAKAIIERCKSRLYFAGHFYPEYMLSELEYLNQNLKELQEYINIIFPTKAQEGGEDER